MATAKRTSAKSAPAPVKKESVAYATFVESLGNTNYPLGFTGESRQIPVERMVQQYGHSTTWVYVSINRIANAMAQIPLNLVNASTPGRYLKTDVSGLKSLLEHPNPFQTRFDFVEALSVSLELTGNAYIELAKLGQNDRPREMYVMDPSKIEIIPDKKKMVRSYVLTVNGSETSFKPEEVIHLKYANPLSDVYGASPLQVAQLAIEMDLGSIAWNRTFLKKGGWPTGAIKTPNPVDAKGLKRLQSDLRRAVNRGAASAGQFLVLTNGLDFTKIALTPKEMDWLDARRMSRDEILAIYGVPFAVAGLFSTEQTTARSAGVAQQVKNFYLFTIFPKMEKVVSALNRALVPRFRNNLACVADLRSVPALQDDVEKQLLLSQTFRTLVMSGWPPNAALAELYPHVATFKHGDVAWYPQTMIPIEGPENPFAKTAAESAAENVPTDPNDPAEGDPAKENLDKALESLGFEGEARDAAARLLRQNGGRSTDHDL